MSHILPHAFGGSGFLGLGHGGWVKPAEAIGAAVATALSAGALGPVAAGALGLSEAGGAALAGGLTGAGLGAGTAALNHENPLTGALIGGVTGGAGGYFAGSALTDALGITGGAADAGVSAAPGVVSSAADGVSADVAPALTAATTPAGATAASVAPSLGIELPASDAANLASQVASSLGGTNNLGLATGTDILSGGIPASTEAAQIAQGGLAGLGGGADTSSAISGAAAPSVSTSGNVTTLSGLGVDPSSVVGAGTGFAGSPELGSLQATAPTAISGGPESGILGKIGNALGLGSLGSAGTKVAEGAGVAGLGKLLGVGAAAFGLGKDVSQGNNIPGMSNLNTLASQAQSQGSVLQGYLTTGTLPPAVQASVDRATADGITAIRARFAGMGIAPGSTQETAAIAQLKQNAVISGATLADQLLQQGISESTLAGTLYNELVKTNLSLNQQTGQAISNLAAALAGGGTRINVGGTPVTVGGQIAA